jgi:hypothetical protein
VPIAAASGGGAGVWCSRLPEASEAAAAALRTLLDALTRHARGCPRARGGERGGLVCVSCASHRLANRCRQLSTLAATARTHTSCRRARTHSLRARVACYTEHGTQRGVRRAACCIHKRKRVRALVPSVPPHQPCAPRRTPQRSGAIT